MENKQIINTLKADIKELDGLKFKHNFTKGFIFNKYSVHLNAFISGGDSCFNKSFREISFKSRMGINKFILLLNDSFKLKMGGF